MSIKMDEDELLFKPFYIPFIPSASPSFVTVGSITSNISNPEPSSQRRTKVEAAARAYDKLGTVNSFAKIPFLRPYIYGLNAITYGLILVDPLDRLE